MKLDIRNLDLVKELLTAVNDEINNNPEKYSSLIFKMSRIMNKYKEDVK